MNATLRGSLPTLDDSAPRLRIAINADSVVTWWADAIADICQAEGLLLDLVIEDQDVGLKRLRDGDVAACLCATPHPIAGARCLALGDMHYHPLASPDYVARHFPHGPSADAFLQAPAIVYGPHDSCSTSFLPSVAIMAASPITYAPHRRALFAWQRRASATA